MKTTNLIEASAPANGQPACAVETEQERERKNRFIAECARAMWQNWNDGPFVSTWFEEVCKRFNGVEATATGRLVEELFKLAYANENQESAGYRLSVISGEFSLRSWARGGAK